MAENEIKLATEQLRQMGEELRRLQVEFQAGQRSVTGYVDSILKIRDYFVATGVSGNALNKGLLQIDATLTRAANNMRGGITSAIQEMNTKMGNARPLVMSMSQAMQDSAQFSMGAAQGIRAVANNVEMMVQQFGYLKSSGMSTKEVLTSMLGVIKGPLGMLVAFSAFSAALQWITQGLTTTKKEAKEATTGIDGFINKIKELDRIGIEREKGVLEEKRRIIKAELDALRAAQIISPAEDISTGAGQRAMAEGRESKIKELEKFLDEADKSIEKIDKKEADSAKKTLLSIEYDRRRAISDRITDEHLRAEKMLEIDEWYEVEKNKTAITHDGLRAQINEANHKVFLEKKLTLDQEYETESFFVGIKARAAAHERAETLSPLQRALFEGGLVPRGPVTGIERLKGKSAGIIKPGVGFGDALAVELDKSSDKAVLFGNTLKNAFREATNELADEFIKVFGLGDNLIGRMGATFLSAMVQLGAELLAQQVIGTVASTAIATTAAGVLTKAWTPSATLASIATLGGAAATGSAAVAAALAGGQALAVGTGMASTAGVITPHASGDYWFNEPTFAVGMKTGQRHIIAENRPEYLMSPSASNRMGQQGRYGAMAGQQPLFLRTEISGSKLALIVESGTRQNSRRRM